ncbi:MAG: hypothetical protein ACXV8M_03495, partial [Candidatus Angelobacter sp.]
MLSLYCSIAMASVFAGRAEVKGTLKRVQFWVSGEQNMRNHDKARTTLLRPVLMTVGLLLITTIAWAQGRKGPGKAVNMQ